MRRNFVLAYITLHITLSKFKIANLLLLLESQPMFKFQIYMIILPIHMC